MEGCDTLIGKCIYNTQKRATIGVWFIFIFSSPISCFLNNLHNLLFLSNFFFKITSGNIGIPSRYGVLKHLIKNWNLPPLKGQIDLNLHLSTNVVYTITILYKI